MDEQTFRLIVQLQLEDAALIKSSLPIGDTELQVVELYEAELRGSIIFNTDRDMARSIHRAIWTDRHALQDMEAQEALAVSDRQLALNVSRGIVNLDTHQGRANARGQAPMNAQARPNNAQGFMNVPNGRAPFVNHFAQPPPNARASPVNPFVQAPPIVRHPMNPPARASTPSTPTPANRPAPQQATSTSRPATFGQAIPRVQTATSSLATPISTPKATPASQNATPNARKRTLTEAFDQASDSARPTTRVRFDVSTPQAIKTPVTSGLATANPHPTASPASQNATPNTRKRTVAQAFDQAPDSARPATRVRFDSSVPQAIEAPVASGLASPISTSTASPASQNATPNARKRSFVQAFDQESDSGRQAPRVRFESPASQTAKDPPMAQAPFFASLDVRAPPKVSVPTATLEPGKAAGKRKAVEIEECKECCTCNEEFVTSEILDAPCGDRYCRACISQVFQNSLTDRALFPPRCCREHIEIDSARRFLGPQLVIEFMNKKMEWETPNPVYCSALACTKFIPPAHVIKDIAVCQACGTATCKMCSKPAHPGEDCPNDTELQQVLQVAQAELWKRCYQCKRVVELTQGCNHITCLCKAEWCYICGTKWPPGGGVCTGGCVLYEEARLLQQAGAQVAQAAQRQPAVAQPAQPVQPVPNARQRRRARNAAAAAAANVDAATAAATANAEALARAVANVHRFHDCTHAGGWIQTFGTNTCGFCEDELEGFLWECNLCEALACNRCKRNRL